MDDSREQEMILSLAVDKESSAQKSVVVAPGNVYFVLSCRSKAELLFVLLVT
jgi:hypothetical protein